MTDATLDTIAAASDRRRGPSALYRAVWRWHFYAGLAVVPFLVTLAVTGLTMLWVGVLDGRDGERSLALAAAARSPVAVSRQADAAVAAVPDGVLKQYLAPLAPDRPALFRVDRGGDDTRTVAVDPSTGRVLESWSHRAGWYDLADRIHGTLLIGTVGDRLIEIAAGFGVVLVVTGLYLWWPREAGGVRRMLVPALRARGRPLLRSLHGSVGFYGGLVLIAFLVSGMAWTGVWGEKLVQAWSSFPAAKYDAVPLSDATHASMNHGAMKEVPWALEETPMPASGSQAGGGGIPAGAPVDIDAVVAFARANGFGADDARFQVNLPADKTGVWTISRDSMSADGRNPTVDRTVHLDRYTGKVLADMRFADYSAAGKAMAVGIALHQGDMGAWNVALNTLFCLGVIFLSASGVATWWLRRPKGAFRLAAPPVPAEVPLTRGVVVLTLFLSLAFPLVGLTLLGVLALDLLVVSRLPRLKAMLG